MKKRTYLILLVYLFVMIIKWLSLRLDFTTKFIIINDIENL